MTKTGRSQEVRVTVIYLLSGGSKGRRGPFDFALMFDESQLFNGFESEPSSIRRSKALAPRFPTPYRRLSYSHVLTNGGSTEWT